VICGELDAGTEALEPPVQFAKLLSGPLDLQGRVGQATAADRPLVGRLDHGDVVVALPK
jgi:hypothetical protein